MKLLYLMASKGWGGMEKHTFEVAGAMAARGHDVTLLCDQEYKTKCPAGVQFEAFDLRASRYNLWLWLQLRRKLKQLAPDVIHAQADKAAFLLGRAGWPQTACAIGTVHNVKSGYGAYQKLDAVIAVSRMIAVQVQHSDVTVIYNGIHFPEPDPEIAAQLQRWRADKPTPLILAIGRLVEAKGFDLLLQAWPADQPASLVILGEGQERPSLEQIIQRRQLQHVYLMGQTAHVAEWIKTADLLVISSRNEGGPYVLSEALMLGLPVISTEVGMVADFLPPSCVVKANDEGQLQQLLLRAIGNPEAIGAACHEVIASARQQLSITAMMDAIEVVYRRHKKMDSLAIRQ